MIYNDNESYEMVCALAESLGETEEEAEELVYDVKTLNTLWSYC